MIKQIVTLAIVVSLLFIACQSNQKTNSGENVSVAIETQNEYKSTDIAFTVAKNYFVNNTVSKLDDPKIETAEEFNSIFGMAATMGKEGKPTEIDFTKQYVIAVLLPETDLLTTIKPVSLKKNEKNEIILTYETVVGQKQSYTTLPNFAIIVDKTVTGNITLKKVK